MTDCEKLTQLFHDLALDLLSETVTEEEFMTDEKHAYFEQLLHNIAHDLIVKKHTEEAFSVKIDKYSIELKIKDRVFNLNGHFV